jgi:hypothetical protein
MKRLFAIAVIIALHIVLPGVFAQSAATPQSTPTQQQPCTAAPSGSQSQTSGDIKIPPAYQKPVSGILKIIHDHTNINLGKPDGSSISNPKPGSAKTPCLGPVPNTQIAPVLKIPVGVFTVWHCNPLVTSTDPSHTQSLFSIKDIPGAEPTQPGVFEADEPMEDLKSPISCGNLRRDLKNNKIFLAQ